MSCGQPLLSLAQREDTKPGAGRHCPHDDHSSRTQPEIQELRATQTPGQAEGSLYQLRSCLGNLKPRLGWPARSCLQSGYCPTVPAQLPALWGGGLPGSPLLSALSGTSHRHKPSLCQLLREHCHSPRGLEGDFPGGSPTGHHHPALPQQRRRRVLTGQCPQPVSPGLCPAAPKGGGQPVGAGTAETTAAPGYEQRTQEGPGPGLLPRLSFRSEVPRFQTPLRHPAGSWHKQGAPDRSPPRLCTVPNPARPGQGLALSLGGADGPRPPGSPQSPTVRPSRDHSPMQPPCPRQDGPSVDSHVPRKDKQRP